MGFPSEQFEQVHEKKDQGCGIPHGDRGTDAEVGGGWGLEVNKFEQVLCGHMGEFTSKSYSKTKCPLANKWNNCIVNKFEQVLGGGDLGLRVSK